MTTDNTASALTVTTHYFFHSQYYKFQCCQLTFVDLSAILYFKFFVPVKPRLIEILVLPYHSLSVGLLLS